MTELAKHALIWGFVFVLFRFQEILSPVLVAVSEQVCDEIFPD